MQSATINFVHRTNIAQAIFCFLDLIVVLFSEDQRNSVFYSISLYFLQFLVILASVVTFFVRLANTYPLRVGLAGTVFGEFSIGIWATVLYFIAFLVARATFVVRSQIVGSYLWLGGKRILSQTL
jgi:hypothetical protein